MDMINLMEESRLVAGCTPDDIAALVSIAKKLSVPAGTRIFAAGDPAEYLYVVLDGLILLRFRVTMIEASREITLDRKSAGETFGWSIFVHPVQYTLSAYSAEDSELMQIRGGELSRLCDTNLHLGYNIMKNISGIIADRYSSMQNMLINSIQQDMQESLT